MLKYRLIFGPIMIATLLGVLYLDARLDQVSIEGTWLQTLLLGRSELPPGLLLLAVFLALIGLASRELAAIFRAKGVAVPATTLWLAGIVGCGLMYLMPGELAGDTLVTLYATLTVAVFAFALLRHAAGRRPEGALSVAGAAMFALLYMGTLPGFYLAIRHAHAVWVIAAIILIAKCCDIGAYFTGKAIGRHKLIPWLSPGKTWEGLVGGMLLSGLVATALAALGNGLDVTGYWAEVGGERQFVGVTIPLGLALLAGLLLGLVGQAGDLTASLFKRDAGIKDSGRSIPGFGGLLDVLDSPLVVAPVAYWLLRYAVASGG